MKINEAIELVAQYGARISELTSLRNDNGYREEWRSTTSNNTLRVKEPMYSVKDLDKTLAKLYKDQRRLKAAIKLTNANTDVAGFEKVDMDAIDMGELV